MRIFLTILLVTFTAGATCAGVGSDSETPEAVAEPVATDDCGQLKQFASDATPIRTLFVDGSAKKGGNGSEEKPFRDLAQAEKVAKPGTEFRLRGEVQARPGKDYGLSFHGEPDAPIWITGEPGARLRGSEEREIPALKLVDTRYLVVQDLELLESPNHVLHFDHSHHLLFRRLHVHRARTACIKGSQSHHVYVEDSDLHGAAELPGGNPASTQVLDFVGVNTGHIVRSKFHDGPGVLVMLKGGTSDLLFAYNELYDQTSDEHGAALHLGQWTSPRAFQPLDAAFEAVRVVAYANLIHDVKGAFLAFGGCDDCAAVHNTMYDSNGYQMVRYLPGSAGPESGAKQSVSRNCRFTGNIVVGGHPGGPSLNADAEHIGPGNALDHNLWLKQGAINWRSPLPRETTTSMFGRDPLLTPEGLPSNANLVRGKGPTDLGSIAFAELFTRDFRGACVTPPRDLGAIRLP